VIVKLVIELEIDEKKAETIYSLMVAKCNPDKEAIVDIVKTILDMGRHWYPFIKLRKVLVIG